jgi:hypothetical protein
MQDTWSREQARPERLALVPERGQEAVQELERELERELELERLAQEQERVQGQGQGQGRVVELGLERVLRRRQLPLPPHLQMDGKKVPTLCVQRVRRCALSTGKSQTASFRTLIHRLRSAMEVASKTISAHLDTNQHASRAAALSESLVAV